MYIERVTEGDQVRGGLQFKEGAVVISQAKRILVGAGARALFYPTLLFNVLRNKIQSEFRWWDRVDEFILLGAVPFPTDVIRLKELGVCGVVTLNEPYETLVPTSLYYDQNIDHLVIATRDYLFAPSFSDICKAVQFIHEHASSGKTTYVHCKAGRGRSTTIVLCYLVDHKQMTPEAAYKYVRSIRPRVRLAFSQWQAVQDYYHHLHWIKKTQQSKECLNNTADLSTTFWAKVELEEFDGESAVWVTESDLEGYEGRFDSGSMWAGVSLACRAQHASQSAVAKLSCLWLRFDSGQKLLLTKKTVSGDRMGHQMGNIGVDMRVY